MNNQEAFDKVVAHLVEQKVPSSVTFHMTGPSEIDQPKAQCLYRGPNGLKCAIGCLIPDEMYFPKMDEGYSFFDLPEIMGSDFHKLFGILDEDLMAELQAFHDRSVNWDETGPNIEGLKYIASCFKLEWNF